MSELIEEVRRHAEYESDEEARTATEAVLTALGKRIARGEAEDIAEYLPDDAAEWIIADEPTEATSLSQEEFVALVADFADTDEGRAYDYVESVLGALSELVPGDEFQGIVSQFPPEYDRLLVEA